MDEQRRSRTPGNRSLWTVSFTDFLDLSLDSRALSKQPAGKIGEEFQPTDFNQLNRCSNYNIIPK